MPGYTPCMGSTELAAADSQQGVPEHTKQVQPAAGGVLHVRFP